MCSAEVHYSIAPSDTSETIVTQMDSTRLLVAKPTLDGNPYFVTTQQIYSGLHPPPQ